MFKSPFMLPVAPALKLTCPAAFNEKDEVVIGKLKLRVAACETVTFPVVHAARLDQVPVPLKNTGPNVLPPELIVLVPVPKKYTFIPVVQEPWKVVKVRFP